jgi:hypothetical protein
VDSDAGGVVGDEYNGLLLVYIRVIGIVLAHDDVNVATRVTCT